MRVFLKSVETGEEGSATTNELLDDSSLDSPSVSNMRPRV